MITWIVLFLAAVVFAFVAAYLMFSPSDTVAYADDKVVELRRDRKAS